MAHVPMHRAGQARAASEILKRKYIIPVMLLLVSGIVVTGALIGNPTPAPVAVKAPVTVIGTDRQQTLEELIGAGPASGAIPSRPTGPGLEPPARLIPSRRVALGGHEAAINAVSWSADGRYFVTASDDKTLKVWEASTNRIIINLDDPNKPQTDRVLSAAWSADNQYIVSTSADKFVRMHSVFSADPVLRINSGTVVIEAGGSVVARDAAISPNNTMVPYPEGNTLRTWNLATDNHGPDFQLGVPASSIRGLAFSGDSRFLAVGLSNRGVQIWDTNGPRLVTGVTVATELNPVLQLDWTPDNRHLVIGRKQSFEVVSFNPATGAVSPVLSQPLRSEVNVLAVSADSQRLAVGLSNGDVQMWSIVSGGFIQAFSSGTAPVTGLHFDPNTSQLMVATGGNRPALAYYRL